MCPASRVSKVAANLQCLVVMFMAMVAYRPNSVVTVASAADPSAAGLLPGADERELLIHVAAVDVDPGAEKWAALGAVEVIPIFQLDPSSEAERELGLGRFLLVRLGSNFDPFAQAREFEALSEVDWARPNIVGRTLCTPNVSLDAQQWSYINPGFNLDGTTGLTYRLLFHGEKARVESGARIDEVRLGGIPGAFPPPRGWEPERSATVTLLIEGDPFEADGGEGEAWSCEMTQR